MTRKKRFTVKEYLNYLYIIYHTKDQTAFNNKLNLFKKILNTKLCVLGLNIVLIGESGAGKSSFIKSFLASLGLQIDIKISDTQACTTGPASYRFVF